ncbi:MAG TPA: DUF6567 family protein, partial [Balneolaceae bacterium]|nr:DUF6567 family protein [Balneolaceae bacterium]
MKHFAAILSVLILSIIITGCASTGAFNTATLTEVQLSEADYEIVAVNVKGKASAGYILGISSAMYARQMQTVALA